MSLNDLMLKVKARGNWGHKGRPGKRGGSSSKGSFAPGSPQDTSIQGDAIRRWNQELEDSKVRNTPERMKARVIINKVSKGDRVSISSSERKDLIKGLEGEGFSKNQKHPVWEKGSEKVGIFKDDRADSKGDYLVSDPSRGFEDE